MAEKTEFQRVIDQASDGCGCACHNGLGYRSSCEHCASYQKEITSRYRAVTCYGANRDNPDHPPIPIYAYIEHEGYEPVIPGALVDKIIRKEATGWIRPLDTARVIHDEP